MRLSAAGPALAGTDAANAYFFPYDSASIDQAKPQAVERGPRGLTLAFAPGPAFTGKTPAQLAGVLVIDGRGPTRSPPRRGRPSPGPPVWDRIGRRRRGALGLWLAMGYAFVGGLILNLMPCVFPILSMKAAALAGHAGETARRRGSRPWPSSAASLSASSAWRAPCWLAQAAGSAVGWGFQLQIADPGRPARAW